MNGCNCAVVGATNKMSTYALYVIVAISAMSLACAHDHLDAANQLNGPSPAGTAQDTTNAPADDHLNPKSPSNSSNRDDTNYDRASIYIKTSEELTLWKIANHISRSREINVNQVMLIILNENPKSFDEYNINSMKAKTLLSFPENPQFTLSDSEAAAEIQRQHTEWNHRNSPTHKAVTHGDDNSVRTEISHDLDQNDVNNDQAQVQRELQLQSPTDNATQVPHVKVAPVPDWEKLPEPDNELANEDSIIKSEQSHQIDGGEINNKHETVKSEREAIELTWNMEMVIALTDRLRYELRQVPPKQLLIDSVATLKVYFHQVTTHHRQWLLVFFIMSAVILLGLIIGRNQRRGQFRNQVVGDAQGQLFTPKVSSEIDSLPALTWTDRDQVLAKITQQSVTANMTVSETSSINKAGAVSARYVDSQESTMTQSHQQETLTTIGTALSARDLVMAQIAMRRRHAAKEETYVSQAKPLSAEEIIEKAKIYIAYGKYAQAITILQSHLHNEPEDIAVKCHLVEAYCLNHQAQEFVLLAEDLLNDLQVNSLEWKKLQGYAYRIVPDHAGFQFDPGIVQSEKQTQTSGVHVQYLEPNITVNDSSEGIEDTATKHSVDSVEQDDDFVIEDCATQLDLAKAYIAMGNAQQAQQALNTVINLGDESQRQQAHQLLAQLANL